jgi:putative transcriptional regulator
MIKSKEKNNSSSSVKNSIFNGLNQALEYSLGNKNNTVLTHKVSISELPNFQSQDIKKIRNKLKLSQNLFAQILGVSKKTVEAWESGKNIPQGPAQRILFIISKNPIILNDLKIVY